MAKIMYETRAYTHYILPYFYLVEEEDRDILLFLLVLQKRQQNYKNLLSIYLLLNPTRRLLKGEKNYKNKMATEGHS